MKKLFFLALLALCMPMSTWANDDNEEFDDNEQEDYNNGSITSSSVSLTYKILTVATGETQADAGTVELEGLASDDTSTTIPSLSIPHLIVHVELDEEYQAHTYYYEVVGIANGQNQGTGPFARNATIGSVTIPYTVEYIGNYAFSLCTALGAVTIIDTEATPSVLETIGDYAFNGASITSINIPESVTTLGTYAFYQCSNLAIDVELPEGLESWGVGAFTGAGITSIVIPDNITSIPNSEFTACANLKTVTMNGSASLGSNVFANCYELESIILTGENPASTGGTETGSGDFSNDGGVTLYVPTGSAAAYLNTNWASDVKSESALSWNFITEPVTVSANAGDGSNYYATYYVDYDDEDGYFLYDATAYTVTGTKDETSYSATITLGDITEGANIPAGTAILVEASAAGDYYLYKEYGATPETATTTGNLLMGAATATTTYVDGSDDDYYFFQLSRKAEDGVAVENSVGFYWGEDEGAPFECAAYRAWLPIEKSVFGSDDDDAAPAKVLYIKKQGDDTTGITSVATATKAATDAIYNLQGVRVSDMSQKGIYIVNGKKVIKN